MLRAGLYARVSTNDQQTLAMQNRAMREYAVRRGWTIAMQVREVNSGTAKREVREKLLESARRREIDLVLVWRLDRWGRSVTDLLATLQELEHLGVGFVSLTEALDPTTPAGRAMAGLLAIFAEFEREILRERTRAGLAHARQNGKRLGRPATAAIHAAEVRKLHRAGVSKSEIARRLRIGRTSVRRFWPDLFPGGIGSLDFLPKPIRVKMVMDAAAPSTALDGNREQTHDPVPLSWQRSLGGTTRPRHP
jgi:DNA invertase Pin-like site-specific DNA recombinase